MTIKNIKVSLSKADIAGLILLIALAGFSVYELNSKDKNKGMLPIASTATKIGIKVSMKGCNVSNIGIIIYYLVYFINEK